MRDPRQGRDPGDYSILRSGAMYGAIAYGGLQFGNSLYSVARNIRSYVDMAKEKNERLVNLYEESLADSERRAQEFSSLRPQYDDMGVEFPDEKMYRPEDSIHGDVLRDIASVEDDIIHVSHEKVDQMNINLHRMLGIDVNDHIEASEKLVTYSSQVRRLEKEYPGLSSILNKISEESDQKIRLLKVKPAATGGFIMKLGEFENGVQTATRDMHLPSLTSGVTTSKGVKYRTVTPVSYSDIGSKRLVGKSVQASVMEMLETALPMSTTTTRGKRLIDRIAGVFEISLPPLVQGEGLTNINTLGGYSSSHYILTDILPHIGKVFSDDASDAFSEWGRKVHGAGVYLTQWNKQGIKELYSPTGERIDLPATAEQAFVTKGKLSTSQMYFRGPLSPLNKQSQFRTDLLSGPIRKPWTATELAARLGATSDVALENVVKKGFSEEIPGRMTNIGFYFGKIPNVGEGSAAFLAKKRISGPKKGSINLEDFRGIVEKNYSVAATEETIKNIESRIDSGNVKVRRGEVLGTNGFGNPVTAEADGVLYPFSKDGGYLRLVVAEEYPLSPGAKGNPGKFLISRIETPEEMSDRFKRLVTTGVINEPEADAMSRFIIAGSQMDRGIELFMEGDMLTKRYGGGNLGLGIMHKMLQDTVDIKRKGFTKSDRYLTARGMQKRKKSMGQAVRSMIEIAFGPEMNHAIESIDFYGDDWDIAIKLKDTEQADFRSFNRLETMVEKAKEGNGSELRKWIQKVEQKAATHKGLPNIRLSLDLKYMTKVAHETNKIIKRTAPTFVVNSDDGGRLIGMQLRTFFGLHQASGARFTRFGGSRQNLNGFAGGAKTSVDHITNAQLMGLDHYVRYLNFLLDYNLPYIADKYPSAEEKLLSSTDPVMKSSDPHIKVGHSKKPVRILSMQGLLDGDLGTRLANNYDDQAALRETVRFRAIHSELGQLAGQLDEEKAKSVLGGEFFTLADLEQQAIVGTKQNSLGLMDAETVNDLMKIINEAGQNGEAVYLKLPMEMSIGDSTGDLVPLHHIDLEDMFALKANVDETLQPNATRLKRHYYTGSQFYTNWSHFFMQLGKIQENQRDQSIAARESHNLHAELEGAVRQYFRGIRQAWRGKNSPMVNRTYKTSVPFSTGGKLSTAEGLGITEIGLDEDSVVKMITNNKVKSYDSAIRGIQKLKHMDEVHARLKHLHDQIPDTITPDVLSDEYLSRMTNAYKDVASGKSSLDKAVRRYMKKAMPGFSSMESSEMAQQLMKHTAVKEDFVSRLPAMKQQVAKVMGVVDGKKDRLALYRYTQETIDRMRSGSLELTGALHGYPELSELSGIFLKIKLLEQDNHGISKGVKDMVRGSKDKLLSDMNSWAEGHIKVSSSVAAQIARDFDGDFLSFILHSFKALDGVAQDVGMRLNLFEEMGMSPELLRGLSEESIDALAATRLVLEQRTSDYGTILTPASISSQQFMKGVENAAVLTHADTVDLKEWLIERREKAGLPVDAKSLDEAVSRINKFTYRDVDLSSGRILSGIDKMGKITTPEEIYRRQVIEGDAYDPVRPLSPEQFNHPKFRKMIREHPDSFRVYHGMRFTDDQLKLRDELLLGSKEEFHKYMRHIEEQQTSRLADIKRATPMAYNTRAALLQITESMSRDSHSKAILKEFADKAIAQNTISSKHGTPDIIGDLSARLKDFGTLKMALTDDTLNAFARGDLITTVRTEEAKDMKRWGYKVENISFETYDDYLALKQHYTGALKQAHDAATEQIDRMIVNGETSKHILTSRYRSEVSSRMESFRILGNKSEFANRTIKDAFGGLSKDEMSPGFLVDLMHEQATMGKKAADKFSKAYVSILAGAEPYEADHLHDVAIKKNVFNPMQVVRDQLAPRARLNTEEMIRNLQTWNRVTGENVFSAESLKAFTSFDSTGSVNEYNLFSAMKKVQEFHEKSSDKVSTFYSENMRTRRIARITRYIGGYGKSFRIANFSPSSRLAAYERNIKESERQLRRVSDDAIQRESTLLRQGSTLEHALGGVNRLTGGAESDILERHLTKSRTVAGLVGLFVGAFAGQSFNQMVSDYQVPDLGDTKGLGGEYFEDQYGIIGKEMEASLKARKPRVTPWYKQSAGFSQDMAQYAKIAGGGSRSNGSGGGTYSNSMRGVYVK